MNDQRERSDAEDDDWWERLYDASAPDTGPAPGAGDTLDDRFASAAHAVGGPPDPPGTSAPHDAMESGSSDGTGEFAPHHGDPSGRTGTPAAAPAQETDAPGAAAGSRPPVAPPPPPVPPASLPPLPSRPPAHPESRRPVTGRPAPAASGDGEEAAGRTSPGGGAPRDVRPASPEPLAPPFGPLPPPPRAWWEPQDARIPRAPWEPPAVPPAVEDDPSPATAPPGDLPAVPGSGHDGPLAPLSPRRPAPAEPWLPVPAEPPHIAPVPAPGRAPGGPGPRDASPQAPRPDGGDEGDGSAPRPDRADPRSGVGDQGDGTGQRPDGSDPRGERPDPRGELPRRPVAPPSPEPLPEVLSYGPAGTAWPAVPDPDTGDQALPPPWPWTPLPPAPTSPVPPTGAPAGPPAPIPLAGPPAAPASPAASPPASEAAPRRSVSWQKAALAASRAASRRQDPPSVPLPRRSPGAGAGPGAGRPAVDDPPQGGTPGEASGRTAPDAAAEARPEDAAVGSPQDDAAPARVRAGYVGDRPPTYDPEPTALPSADEEDLSRPVADTVLDGARYGSYTLRAASVRGDSARYRGEPRRDALLTARFGTGDDDAFVLVAVATGARAGEATHRAAADVCQWIGSAVGRSRGRLADDLRTGRSDALRPGLQRLTERTYGRLRAQARQLGLPEGEYTAGLRCLLLPCDPLSRTRVFFGAGGGALLRLRRGEWEDLEPAEERAGGPQDDPLAPPPEIADGERLTLDLAVPQPRSPYVEPPVPAPAQPFRFLVAEGRPGDTLLLCSAGLADPLRGESALAGELAGRWSAPTPPGLVDYLADMQIRVKGYADDRTAVAVWEA